MTQAIDTCVEVLTSAAERYAVLWFPARTNFVARSPDCTRRAGSRTGRPVDLQ